MSFLAVIVLLLIVAAIVAGVGWALSRQRHDGASGDQDLIAYGLLAIAVGTTIFAIAQLGRAAFPGANLVGGGGGQQVATALASLVVGGPIAVLLWRRQDSRRDLYPAAAGWPVYLAVAEAVLAPTLIVVTFQLLDWLLFDGPQSSWTDVIVVGAAWIFHEVAARIDPPGGDARELPRVAGSAVGLVVGSIGLGGLLLALFEYVYGTVFASAGSVDVSTPSILLVLGGALWAHRWLREWDGPPALPRNTYLVLVSWGALVAAIASVTVMVIGLIIYLVDQPSSASDHFSFMPAALMTLIVGAAVWAHHERRLGVAWDVVINEDPSLVQLRDNSVRSYDYLMAATGLSIGIGALTGLAALAFGREILTGASLAAPILSLAFGALVALGTWGWFWAKGQSADRAAEAVSAPRKFYLVGMAVIAGLVAAQALIATLFVLFQMVFDLDPSRNTLAVEGPLAVFATLATVHLMMAGRSDRGLREEPDAVVPFTVTIICSHPGPLAGMFPREAKTRVIYRGGDAAVSDEMAEQIVAAVGRTSSIVWVDAEGFRIAPARAT